MLKFTLANEGDLVNEENRPTLEELKEQELRIEQLTQKVAVLEAERKYLHQRLHSLLNSKSWKLTAPLRIFTSKNR
ncbi:hypothetical protein H1D32_21360 [Anaerobacillus sp. CMMVII]|uniref:hypothetical protein n=1 Tax=Anaerobacillus sp. CMMVII TaxID=2755588 RepID=UPI0021B77A7E|nr:hypothetical protein [Anaerobacillus sp. CMMVII]MCT8140008.1 hypothetical protein [Anaerobacillus sp. CMMVII]